MQNRENWQASKYVYRKGKLTASRNPKEVSVSSRLIVDLIADFYDRSLERHAKGTLLDLGCGKVPLYAAYREYVDDNVCVDWGNSLHKNSYLDHEVDLTERLPFEEGQFDTIILSDVLEHIPVPELLWSEMTRVLAARGKIIMNVPFYYWLHEAPYDFYRYTEFALRRFAENNGLAVVELQPLGGAPEVIADVLAKNLVRLPRIGRPLAAGAQGLGAGFIRTGFGKRVSEGTGRSFPLGYCMVAEKRDG